MVCLEWIFLDFQGGALAMSYSGNYAILSILESALR
jgi:hypothetical protein